MTNLIQKLLIILLLHTPFFVFAEEINLEKQSDDIHPMTMFLIVEGMLGVNAWLASEDPQAYGLIGALLFPFAAGEGNNSDVEKWVGLIGAESIALYNLSIDKDKKTKSEIFKENVIAWHLFAGILLATNYLVGDEKTNETISVEPVAYGGAQLVYNYKF